MTTEQKEKIYALRHYGMSYKTIAESLSLKESNVKTYCFRNGLTDKDIEEQADKCRCLNCGSVLEKREKQKPRRFCSDKCRYAWWNSHRQIKPNANGKKTICDYCGKEFTHYGSEQRKYCSHSCYVSARYGKAN